MNDVDRAGGCCRVLGCNTTESLGAAKRHCDLDRSLDDLCDVHEEASNSPDASETGVTELVRGIAEMTISKPATFLMFWSLKNTIYYQLLHLSGDHTAFYAREIGVTSSHLDVRLADDVADKDGQFFGLVTGADDAEPGCRDLKPLPGVVRNVGSLAVYRPKYGYITTAFGLVACYQHACEEYDGYTVVPVSYDGVDKGGHLFNENEDTNMVVPQATVNGRDGFDAEYDLY
ncbi:hypothetical protein DL766_002721 [Monosporascus sp. MC13-8B]|uniref:Uncharacterized protein n=1 Tax=Monosporascus cannonballus TaxID=155416 RepID=A0ABY0HII0_9PEZI|nr:hypothetical protein DL762_000704 [Monosporascus cannonballus]RYO97991.1 hypothetical protein DL763_002496 [Monosporascus cannonballus]RYP35007.1 hypothetical protein DL766_002721 [Monosporascus sp. MC13-8B]